MKFSDRITVELATGFGLGLAPKAPGTVGTLLGFPIVWLVCGLSLFWQVVLLAVLCVVGIPICGRAANVLGLKDPGCVVWDEFVTLPIVFLGLSHDALTPFVLALGFGLHRLFDISKLPPGRQLERMGGGLGIMSDDIAAGVYGCLVLQLVLRFVAV